jgi:hypothetical protein
MDNSIIENYYNKFQYILIGLENDLQSQNKNDYVTLLNNEDIVSSLFKDTFKDIIDYSDIYDVNIKLIDDIKILCFLYINFYKIIEKDTKFTKKYIIFHSMIYRFKKLLPNKMYNNKILFKIEYMVKSISTYSDLLNYYGRFGIFQILKSIYNIQNDYTKEHNEIFDTINLFEMSKNINYNLKDKKVVNEGLKELENENGEISAQNWISQDNIKV